MGAVTDLDDLTTRLLGGSSGTPRTIAFFRSAFIAGAAITTANTYKSSYWRNQGLPGAGAAPGGTVRIPTRATAGALAQADPGGGRALWLTGGGIAVNSSAGATVQLYDRLLDISGFSGTVTTAQNVAGSITRYTGGAGNQIWVEIYTAVGGTATTITASYTNQAGTTGRTTATVTFGGASFQEAARVIPLSLQAGDTGVQAVASVTVLATTGTAGDFGVTIAHPLATFSSNGFGGGGLRDLIPGGMIEIATGACLALTVTAGTSSILTNGHFNFVEA